ncbi:MAG: hypothetical protein H7246_07050 [Phycisphaerae bacterium]|nr:hypothetical protein [Saprospiraceae bacterium]
MKVDYIIKNKVSEQDFERAVYNWLAEGDYTPDDIIENIITQNNLVLLPLHFYMNDYQGTCSASLGYSRTEYYQVWNDTYKRSETRSRMVTNWVPHSQPVQGTVTTVVYAGDKNLEGIALFVENMGWRADELNQIGQNEANYAPVLSLFKVNGSDSWNNKGAKKAYNSAVQQTLPLLPSNLVQNFNLNIRFSEKKFFSLVAPFWLFIYEYQEQQYYVVVDGNDPSRVDGIKPEDKKRKNSVIALRWYGWIGGIVASLFGVYYFSGQTFAELEINWKNIGIFAAGFILTWILIESKVTSIKKKSIKARKEVLKKKFNQ